MPTNWPELGTGANASDALEASSLGEGKKDDILLLGGFPFGKTAGEAEIVGTTLDDLHRACKLANKMAVHKIAENLLTDRAINFHRYLWILG